MKAAFERLFWIGFALLALASVVAGFRNGLQLVDFQWLPVRILANGENPYLYSLNHVPFMGCQVDANQVPSCLALLLPFAFLPRWTANAVWDVCNLGFAAIFFGCLWRLWFKDKLGVKWFWFVVCLTLVGTPWRVLIGNGQHLMFSLAFFFLAYYVSQTGRKWCAGILLALALFKYTTVAPMCLIFLVRREWKVLFVCVGIHMVLTLGVGACLNENPFELVIQSVKVGSGLVAHGDADAASMLRSFGVVNVEATAMLGYVFFGLLGLVIALRGRRDELLVLATFAVIANVMFYHRVYDFVTLLFPLVYAVRNLSDRSRLGVALRWTIFANVALVFFGIKALRALDLQVYVLCCAAAEHVLLFLLLMKGRK